MLAGKENGLAIVEMNETNLSHPKEYSWRDLGELVRHYADALKSSGLEKGDVVARKGKRLLAIGFSLILTVSWNSCRIELYTFTRPSACHGCDWRNFCFICNRYGRQGCARVLIYPGQELMVSISRLMTDFNC